MNQPTHAYLAVEAFRTIQKCSTTDAGKRQKLDKLALLLGQHLDDVVVAAWLPDSLIKDMTYGHVFKTSKFQGADGARFIVSRADLKKRLAPAAFSRERFLDRLPDAWWAAAYRVKDNGGHLPTRVSSLCQNARDMLKMGDKEVYQTSGVKAPAGNAIIAEDLLYSTRDVAVMMWMTSHYIADAHMPFHCDNRKLASTSSAKNAHSKIEELWGVQVPPIFQAKTILAATADQILAAPLPDKSKFAGFVTADAIPPLKSGGDPWLEAVNICRASFALSFNLVTPDVAPVDDQAKPVSLDDILKSGGFCGEERFWDISRAIMHDAALAIAMFWQDVWGDFVKGAEN
jgi:hypothetical protein